MEKTNETKTIWIKGSNEHFKDKKLFKCVCKIDGDKLILGEPFIKGIFSLEKFKDNSEENPFNYMITISTYEKVLNKKDRFEEFYNYLDQKAEELKINLNSEENYKNITSDGIYLSFRCKTGKIQDQVSLDIFRESITKIRVRIDNFRDKQEKIFLDKEFNEFKEYMDNSIKSIIETYKDKNKSNPYMEKVRSLVKEFEGEEKTDKYRVYSYNRDYGDNIYLDLEFENYKIPGKFNDSIKNYKDCFNYRLVFEKEGFREANGGFNPKKEVLEIKDLDKLREFFIKELEEGKNKSIVTQQEARQEIERLTEEYNKENTLTQERFEEIKNNYKVGDKVTLYGVDGTFSSIDFEGKILRFEENKIAVVYKGGRTRGIILRVGDRFKKIEGGYIK